MVVDRGRIDLSDPACARIDRQGRSLAILCMKKPVLVDQKLIDELKSMSKELNGADLRLCLHSDISDTFHEMIILQHYGRYYPPHKHRDKGESYHIIEGELGALVFDDEGVVTASTVLGRSGQIIYRVGENTFHTVLPLSDFVIYHESKSGPFVRETDSIFPDWAPDGKDIPASTAFREKLEKELNG